MKKADIEHAVWLRENIEQCEEYLDVLKTFKGGSRRDLSLTASGYGNRYAESINLYSNRFYDKELRDKIVSLVKSHFEQKLIHYTRILSEL